MTYKRVSFLFISLLILSCASPQNDVSKEPEVATMKASDIQVGPIRHDSLSNEQLENIKAIHAVFSDVDTSSLETLITNFKRDLNPDKEIAIWLQMASVYQHFKKEYKGELSNEKKVDAYTLILMRSMMEGKEAIEKAELKVLTPKEAQQIVKSYNSNPEPITVIK